MLIKLWDIENGLLIATLEGHSEGISDIAWSSVLIERDRACILSLADSVTIYALLSKLGTYFIMRIIRSTPSDFKKRVLTSGSTKAEQSVSNIFSINSDSSASTGSRRRNC